MRVQVAALVRMGASGDTQDSLGITSLHWAASKGVLAVVRVLVEEGRVFPNHTEYHEERYTPLDYAIMSEHHEVGPPHPPSSPSYPRIIHNPPRPPPPAPPTSPHLFPLGVSPSPVMPERRNTESMLF